MYGNPEPGLSRRYRAMSCVIPTVVLVVVVALSFLLIYKVEVSSYAPCLVPVCISDLIFLASAASSSPSPSPRTHTHYILYIIYRKYLGFPLARRRKKKVPKKKNNGERRTCRFSKLLSSSGLSLLLLPFTNETRLESFLFKNRSMIHIPKTEERVESRTNELNDSLIRSLFLFFFSPFSLLSLRFITNFSLFFICLVYVKMIFLSFFRLKKIEK